MIRICSVLILFMITGCASITISNQNKDGGICTATYTSIFRDVQGIEMNACGGKGKAGTAGNEALIQSLVEALRGVGL